MRFLELRRHTDDNDDALTPDGVHAAEEIARTGLHPPYALFVTTGAGRATQMLEILRAGAGQPEVPVTVVGGLRSAVEDRWREAARAAGKGADLDRLRAVDPDLVEKESALLGRALRGVLYGLPEGGRALVVGHSPTNEAAVLGLTNHVVPPLAKGAGVLVAEERDRFEVTDLDGGSD